MDGLLGQLERAVSSLRKCLGSEPYSQNPSLAVKHDSVLTTVGATPLIKLNRLAPEHVTIYVKCEAFNPMGSVKDRLALAVIEWAEVHNQIKPGQTVVEASSGNTGIGLAMVCAAKGYPFVCVMAESFSIERRKLMRFLGAKVVLTNPAHKGSGMVIKAAELAQEHGWFLPQQFENEANAWVHTRTTAPEILDALGSEPLHHFFTGYGTGGTLKGVSRYLREHSPQTQIHACEPDNAPLLFSNVPTAYPSDDAAKAAEGAKAVEGATEPPPLPEGLPFKEPHPVWRPHLLQGWAADFIPKLVDDAVKANCVDHVVHVGGDRAMEVSRLLARQEGIFTGTSGGGTLACALEFSKTAPAGSTLVVMLADTGERYLSTPLFADIPADMTDEEKALAASTPSAPPPAISLPAVNAPATQFVEGKNGEGKVVIWSLEYCEFCWTITRLFDRLKVPYLKIDIDAFEYAKDNLGNQYRAALCAKTDCKTFPQYFVDGKFMGGAADACTAWNKKELQPVLEKAGVKVDDFGGYDGNAYEFLPLWMSQNPLRSK